MNDLIKAKLKVAGIHLCISVFIFIGILYLILVEWYPGVFFEAEGGWSGVKLMAVVHLVLGPILTLIIFNHTKTKKEIFLDLSLIAVVQISALIWGGLQVYSERPVAMVMWEGTFYTVTEDYYSQQNLNLKNIASFSDEKPLIIYAETDNSVVQLKEIIRLTDLKIPPFAQVHLYQSVKENFNKMLSHQLSSDFLLTYSRKEDAEGSQHVFLGKAKHKNLLVHMDSAANLLKITMRPVL
ncbi:MAG: hypothetical protein COB77_06980 [Gammaproteobacteria bacterium]|nr:MAG: hypothetical protein COB77_06980 [Gammaproteobacteria bacterium]